MSSYKNNKDGTLDYIGTNLKVQNRVIEEYVTEEELQGYTRQFDELPIATEEFENQVVQYMGESDGKFIQGRFYKCISDGETVPTYNWTLVTAEREFDEDNVRILINKGKNLLFSAQKKPSGQAYYPIFFDGFVKNTTYKIYLKPSIDCTLTPASYIDMPTTRLSTSGGWYDFSTTNTVPSIYGTFCHFNSNSNEEITFENICAVKASDWYEGMQPITDYNGYLYKLPISLKNDANVTEKLVYHSNDGWHKETSYHDTFITESAKLDDRSNAILNLASHLANNTELGFDVALVDSQHNPIYNAIDFTPQDIDYIKVADYRFMHQDKEIQLNAMTHSDWALMNIDGSDTSLAGASLEPFIFFDTVNLGCDIIQVSIENGIFFDGNNLKPQSEYQLAFDAIDYIINMGLRVILKFYTFDWRSDDVINRTLILEKMFVDRYKNNKYVIGYSVANEPSNNHYTSEYADRYNVFMSSIHQYITNNTQQIMFYEQDSTSIDHTVHNTAYESHYYSPMSFSHSRTLDVYPYEKFVNRSSNMSSALYKSSLVSEPSIYPSSKYMNGVAGTTGWVTLCAGKIPNRNSFNNELLVEGAWRFNTTTLGTECVDLKNIAFNFYDADGNVVRHYDYVISENENLTKYTVIRQKDNNTTFPTNYLTVIQDETSGEYALRLTGKGDSDKGASFQIHLMPKASTVSYIDVWYGAFNDNETYLEIIADMRMSSEAASWCQMDAILEGHYCDYAVAGTPYYMEHILGYRDKSTTIYKEPLYIGEAGVAQSTYKSNNWSTNDKGGDIWAEDFLRVTNDLHLSYAWFVYAHAGFGIYGARNLWDMMRGFCGLPVYKKVRDGVSQRFSIFSHPLDTEITQYSKNAPTTNAVYNALELKANTSEIAIVGTLPTASETYLGKFRIYNGTSATLSRGAIYECVSDGASTPTYSWQLVSVPLDILKTITAASSDFADYQSRIAAL